MTHLPWNGVTEAAGATALSGIHCATITAFAHDGWPVVICAILGDEAIAARSVVPWAALGVGSEVVVAFDAGDRMRPVIMGLLTAPDAPPASHVVIEATEELELRCGDSTVRLTSQGKVVTRGEYVISRARRTNRIEGGSVQIN